MRGDAFIHFVCGSRRVNIRLGVLLLIPKSPHIIHLNDTTFFFLFVLFLWSLVGLSKPTHSHNDSPKRKTTFYCNAVSSYLKIKLPCLKKRLSVSVYSFPKITFLLLYHQNLVGLRITEIRYSKRYILLLLHPLIQNISSEFHDDNKVLS